MVELDSDVVAALVVVPPGCGSASGTLVPASQLDDHSNDGGPIGTQLNPYLADLTFDMITVGTPV